MGDKHGGVFLLARCFCCHQTNSLINERNQNINLAPSDFHLLGLLKESLRGIKFANNEKNVQQHIIKFLHETNKLLCYRHQPTSIMMEILY